MAKGEVEGVPKYDDVQNIEPSKGGEGWNPELPKVKFEGLLGKQLVFLEISDKRESSFGTPDSPKFYLLARAVCPGKALSGELEDETVVVDAGAEFTTSVGRVRIFDQLSAATFPSKGAVSKGSKSSGGFDIWELEPWS